MGGGTEGVQLLVHHRLCGTLYYFVAVFVQFFSDPRNIKWDGICAANILNDSVCLQPGPSSSTGSGVRQLSKRDRETRSNSLLSELK